MHRRQFCRTVAAGTVGLAAVGSASASESEAGVPGVVSTRGHFDVAWYGDYLVDGYTETGYDVEGTVPGYESESPEELVVMLHGYGQSVADGREIIDSAATGFASAGYDGPTVGYSWDSDFSQLNWWDTVDIAGRNGPKLAQFCRDYRGRNPETTLRVVGHSLGAEIVCNAVATLDEADADGVIDSVTLLGAAVDDEALSLDAGLLEDEYGPEIERRVDRCDNFYKTDDETLTGQYEFAEWDDALGAAGLEGEAPANFTDHQVDYVAGHERYFEDADGCASAVVDTW
jgi:pimeloyl-ACP methyl ester carboxylesterase